ncbi:SRPBCC family protein [Spirosoma soli]|uniref:SRPBCC family protein n=1 Tax=Spirosoma soli TaxID=1770529 RepID=A0ABW5M3J2_9BACT
MKLIFSAALLATTLTTQAQTSNTHFSHTLETTVSPDTIWRIWTDVPNWKQWDSGLQSAELLGPFEQGVQGVLVPNKGPKSRFVIDSIVPHQSYTFRTKLLLGTLYVKRYLTVQENKTRFTHEVWFTGLTKNLFGKALGKDYRAMLPSVMEKLNSLAKNSE